MRSSLRKLLLCAAIGFSSILASTLLVRTVSAFPKPSVYPVSWDLKFQHTVPKRIVVITPGTTIPVAYWYMPFTVTNLTDQEQNKIIQRAMMKFTALQIEAALKQTK